MTRNRAKLLPLLVLSVLLFPGCESTDTLTLPGGGQIPLIEGTWTGTITLTQVTGTGCIPRLLRTLRGVAFTITADISQEGDELTISLSSSTANLTLSGSIDDLGALALGASGATITFTEGCGGDDYELEVVDASISGSASDTRLAFTLGQETEIRLAGELQTTMSTEAEVEMTR